MGHRIELHFFHMYALPYNNRLANRKILCAHLSMYDLLLLFGLVDIDIISNTHGTEQQQFLVFVDGRRNDSCFSLCQCLPERVPCLPFLISFLFFSPFSSFFSCRKYVRPATVHCVAKGLPACLYCFVDGNANAKREIDVL